jgi:hypothetical protein
MVLNNIINGGILRRMKGSANDFGINIDEHTMALYKSKVRAVAQQTGESTYEPAWSEQYIIDNADKLGYNPPGRKLAKACQIWENQEREPKLYEQLHAFLDELDVYNATLNSLPEFDDNRKRLAADPDACDELELHADGLVGLFPSLELSKSSAGWMEPLFPPFRHPKSLCFQNQTRRLLDRTYMVHDYASMCRKLKPHSRTVLIDMGAALDFHSKEVLPPPVVFWNEYRRAGFHFDHIYGFEMKEKVPAKVFKVLPPDYLAAFHWINIGVSSDPESPYNPLYNILLKHYNEDDFVVVKLDIDTPSVEMELIMEMLEDKRLHSLIDVFYFEHHALVAEMDEHWGDKVDGSIGFSLEVFQTLRKVGIPVHYWI